MDNFLLGTLLGICITLLILLFTKDFILTSFFSKMITSVRMIDENGHELNPESKETLLKMKELKNNYIDLLDDHNQLIDNYNSLLKLKFEDTKLADYYIELYAYLCLLTQAYELLKVNQLIDTSNLKDVYTRISKAMKSIESDMTDHEVNFKHIKTENETMLQTIRNSTKN